ncbi:MAG: ERCC4 domain-containing protein [Phycisphaerales bacterium]|nr:ERCC4 domain-containing protein [Phycisphaerales bacterium]
MRLDCPTTKPQPCIVVDSREQTPLLFTNLPTKTATLDSGDYSIDGLTHLIAVERKSLDDLLACCGRERDRFKRELQRLRAYRFRLLVIEADAATLEAGAWRSTLQPNHVMGSLAAWTAQSGLPVWLAGTHDAAGRFVERYLYQCARAVLAENSSAVGLVEAGALLAVAEDFFCRVVAG